MGIQIYIEKSALAARDIRITAKRSIYHSGCQCQAVMTTGQYCEECASYAEDWEQSSARVEGLPVIMHDAGDVLWHDANRWGPSRKLILEFIDKYKLVEDEDWYEG